MSQSGGSDKATFRSVDEGEKEVFTVQYNPKEFQVQKSVTWEESKTQKKLNTVQYQKSSPMTASFDLMFDTTHDGSNVQATWVNKLLGLTNADIKVDAAKTSEAAELPKERPRVLLFHWGTFEMLCVIDSINVTYLMFASNGQALRARCSVKLREWVPTGDTAGKFSWTDGSSGFSAEKFSLVQVTGGQTVSQVAASNGADTRAVAAANGITDLMADMTGKTLAIPKN